MENIPEQGELVERLSRAAAGGLHEEVLSLIEMGVDVNEINRFGRTALQAVRLSSLKCVDLLLSAGANPNVSDITLRTPVHDAAEAGFLDVLQCLLAYGGVIVNGDRWGNTPAHLAAKKGYIHIVQFLALGMDLKSTNNDGLTVFDIEAMIRLRASNSYNKFWMDSYRENPKSLKVLSVINIRTYLSTEGLQQLRILPVGELANQIPPLLKDFIMLQR